MDGKSSDGRVALGPCGCRDIRKSCGWRIIRLLCGLWLDEYASLERCAPRRLAVLGDALRTSTNISCWVSVKSGVQQESSWGRRTRSIEAQLMLSNFMPSKRSEPAKPISLSNCHAYTLHVARLRWNSQSTRRTHIVGEHRASEKLDRQEAHSTIS